MGLYNEVFKKCPHCENGTGYLQIGCVNTATGTHEFSQFNLDNLEALADDLDETGLADLYAKVRDRYFVCGEHRHGEEDGGCGCSFLLEETRTARMELARRLFGED